MEEKKKHPLVFISYSWDNMIHEKWVRQLAGDLMDNGVKVILDQWENKPGDDIPHFMDESGTIAERVICVLTPNYKLKACQLIGGVGYEYRNITAEMFDNVLTNKFIPVLRNGSPQESIPVALFGRVYVDMRDDSKYAEKIEEILREIYNKPKYPKPKIGLPPRYDY